MHSSFPLIDQTKTVFPLQDYPQNADKWIPPTDPHYRSPFISAVQQHVHFNALMRHYFGQSRSDESPWNAFYIHPFLGDGGAAKESISAHVNHYTHPDARYYGENFMLLDMAWKEQMRHLALIPIPQTYLPSSRGISLKETAVRLLPTAYPAFNDPSQAGEGYPLIPYRVPLFTPAPQSILLAPLGINHGVLLSHRPSVAGPIAQTSPKLMTFSSKNGPRWRKKPWRGG